MRQIYKFIANIRRPEKSQQEHSYSRDSRKLKKQSQFERLKEKPPGFKRKCHLKVIQRESI